MAGLLNWAGRAIDKIIPGDQSGLHAADKKKKDQQAAAQPQAPQYAAPSMGERAGNLLTGIANTRLKGIEQLLGRGPETPGFNPVTIGDVLKHTPITQQVAENLDPNVPALQRAGQFVHDVGKEVLYQPAARGAADVLATAARRPVDLPGVDAQKPIDQQIGEADGLGNKILAGIGVAGDIGSVLPVLKVAGQASKLPMEIGAEARVAPPEMTVPTARPSAVSDIPTANPGGIDVPASPRPAPVVEVQRPPKELTAQAQQMVKAVTPDNGQFAAKLDELGKTLGVETKMGPLKTPERIAQKAHLEYNGDISQVRDSVRGMLHVSDPAQIQGHLEEIAKHYPITRVNELDGTATHGYKDTKVNVQLPSGHQAEIQVITPEMAEAKKVGHALYKQARTETDANKLAVFENKMRDIYGQADAALNARLTSSGESSVPLNSASAGGNAAPDSTTVPETFLPSETSRTSVPSTSKNLSYGSAIEPPSLTNIPENGAGVKQKISPQSLNTNNLNISDEAKAEVNALTVPDEVARLSNKETEDFAKKVGIDTKTYTIDQTKEVIAKQLNLRRDITTMTNEADRLLEAGDLAGRAKLLRAIAEKGRTSTEQGTHIARQLQARRILANELDTPMTRVFKLLDTAGVNLDVAAKKFAGVDMNDANAVVKAYRELVPPKRGEWLDTIRYNSMLSSPLTQINNLFPNLQSTALITPVEKTLTGVLDAIKSAATGKPRKYAAGEGSAYAKGYFKSFAEAKKRFSDSMSGTAEAANLDMKGHMPMYAHGQNKAYDVLSYPMRLMEAMDGFFTGLTEGGVKAALKHRVSKGIDLPTFSGKRGLTTMNNTAEAESAYRLYRQPLGDDSQGHFLKALDIPAQKLMELRNSKNAYVALPAKFTVPFVRTTMNIFKQGFEYSPAGVLTLHGSANKTEQLSKMLLGTAVVGTAAAAIPQDRITWAEPTNAKQKDAFKAAGMQPYSIKIGNNWISFQKLPPAISFNLAMVAGLHDAEKNAKLDQNGTDNILTAVAKYGQFLSDQSYTKSAGNFLKAVQGDKQATTQLASGYPQQLVPFRALSNWFANMTDDTQRKINTDAGFAQKQVEALMQVVPGLREHTTARTDSSGNPLPAQHPFLNSVSPAKVTTENEAEAAKLADLQSASLDTANKKILKAEGKATDATGDTKPILSGTKALDDAQTRIDTASKKLPTDISSAAKDTLLHYARLTETGKEKFNNDPQKVYQLKLAQYEQDKKTGKLSALDEFKTEQNLGKMAITSKYSQDVQDLYSMSKASRTAILNAKPELANLMPQVQQMSAELSGKSFTSGDKIAKASKAKKAKKPKNLAPHLAKLTASRKAAASAKVKTVSSNSKGAKAKVKKAGQPKQATITTRKQLA